MQSLRRQLRSWRARALKCGDIDAKCVDHVYKKIAEVSAAIGRLTHHHHIKHGRCAHSTRSRKVLLKQIAHCSDDDARCVKKLFHRVARINRSQSDRCRAHNKKHHKKHHHHEFVPKHLRSKERTKTPRHILGSSRDPFTIKNINWRLQYTCKGLNDKFNQWLERQHRIRAYFLAEAAACGSDDTDCLRGYFRKVVSVHRVIRRNREKFARRLSRCDVCGAIKVRFRKWYRRQRSRRKRIHFQIALCTPGDHGCMQNHVNRIKAIQAEMGRRLKKVLALHKECVFSKIVPTMSHTEHPIDRASAASMNSFSMLAIIASLVVATVLF